MTPADDAEGRVSHTMIRMALEHAEAVAGPGTIARILDRAGEDRPAGVFMCVLVAFGATVIALVAAMFARKLQNALRAAQ